MSSVQVAVRVRPLNEKELSNPDCDCILSARGKEITVRVPYTNGAFTHKFAYDHTFWSANKEKTNSEVAVQQTVFKGVGSQVVESCFEGFNVCVFTYGQTGSGKSYTMFGNTSVQSEIGLIPRITHKIFGDIEKKKSSLVRFHVRASYMEIYNERVKCLLNPSLDGVSLKVREHPETGPYVENLTQMEVRSHQEVFHVMDDGNKLRTTAATNMNAHSSRSHAVFQLLVTQEILMEDCDEVLSSKTARLNLVDLAGSERVSKTQATGTRLQEGANINKSLTTLGQVISALADMESATARKKHIPYRDSVLTYILKDNLGGNSKTIMIATVSPASDNYEETMSTLRYAERAKKIVNKAIVNEDQNNALVVSLRDEIQKLQDKLKSQAGSKDSEEELAANRALMQQLQMSWEEKLSHAKDVAQQRGEEIHSVIQKKEELEAEVEGLMLEQSKQKEELSNLHKQLQEKDSQVESVLRLMKEKELEYETRLRNNTSVDEKAEIHLLRQQMAVMASQLEQQKRIDDRKRDLQAGLDHKVQALLHTLHIASITDEERLLMHNLHVKDMAMVYDQLAEGADTAEVWSNLMLRLEGKSGFHKVVMEDEVEPSIEEACLAPAAVTGSDEDDLQCYSPTKAGRGSTPGGNPPPSSFEPTHTDLASPHGKGADAKDQPVLTPDNIAEEEDVLDDILGGSDDDEDDDAGPSGGASRASGAPPPAGKEEKEKAHELLDEILGDDSGDEHKGPAPAGAATPPAAKSGGAGDEDTDDLLDELLPSSEASSSGYESSTSDALDELLASSDEDTAGKDLLDDLLDDDEDDEAEKDTKSAKKKKKKKKKKAEAVEKEGLLMDGQEKDTDKDTADKDEEEDALLDELLGDNIEAGNASVPQAEAVAPKEEPEAAPAGVKIGQQDDGFDATRTKLWNVVLFNCTEDVIAHGDAFVEKLMAAALKDPTSIEKLALKYGGKVPEKPSGEKDYVKRLTNFYCFYNKSRLPQVETIVHKVQETGKARFIMDTACKKYMGSEPVLLSDPPRLGVQGLKNSHWFWGPILAGRGPPAYIPDEDGMPGDDHPLKGSPLRPSTTKGDDGYWRQRLQRFFDHHKQKRSPEHIDQLLSNFKGMENQMMHALVERYGPEPGQGAPTDSTTAKRTPGKPTDSAKKAKSGDAYGSTNNPIRVDVNSVDGHGSLLSGFSVTKLNPKYGKIKDKLSKERIWVIDFFKRTFSNVSGGRATQVYPANYLFRIEKMFHCNKQLKLSFFKAAHPFILEFGSSEMRQRFYELAWAMRRHICWMPDLVPKSHHSVAVNVKGKSRKHKNINGQAIFHLTRDPVEMLSVWCGTLSLANVTLPPPGTASNSSLLTGFLPRPSKYDLHFICLTDLPELFSQNPLELVKYFRAYCAETDLHPFLSTNLGGSSTVVLALARRRHISKVGNMEAIELRDNNTMVVGLSLRYGESTMALVAARINPSMPLMKKNQKVATIMRKLEIGDCRVEFSSRFDYVILLGALGYRGHPGDSDDELQAEINSGSVMTGYTEPTPTKQSNFQSTSMRAFVKTARPSTSHPIVYTTTPSFPGATIFATALAMQRPYLGSLMQNRPKPTQYYFTELILKVPHKEIVTHLGTHLTIAVMSPYMEGSSVMVRMNWSSREDAYVMANSEDVPPVHMVTPTEDFLRRQMVTFSIVSATQQPTGEFPYSPWATGNLCLKHYSAEYSMLHFQCSVYRTALKVGVFSGKTIRTPMGTSLMTGLKRAKDGEATKAVSASKHSDPSKRVPIVS